MPSSPPSCKPLSFGSKKTVEPIETWLAIGKNPKSTVISPLLSSASSCVPPWCVSVMASGSRSTLKAITGEITGSPLAVWVPLSSPSSSLSSVSVVVEDRGALAGGVGI